MTEWHLRSLLIIMQEAITKEIPAEESSLMVLRMLKHCYMLSYDDNLSETHENDLTSLHVNTQMYIIGDKYFLESLKNEAFQKFRLCLEKEDQLDKCLEVLPIIYSNTPTSDESLRLLARKLWHPQLGSAFKI